MVLGGWGLINSFVGVSFWECYLRGDKIISNHVTGMIGYGMAKAAVQQLVASLAGENSGMPKSSLVAAILP